MSKKSTVASKAVERFLNQALFLRSFASTIPTMIENTKYPIFIARTNSP